jgi:uncharacterized protein (DUF433 family)
MTPQETIEQIAELLATLEPSRDEQVGAAASPVDACLFDADCCFPAAPGDSMSNLPAVLVPHPHVRVDPNILGGSPYVAGSRVPVRRIYAVYQAGASFEKLAKRYPQLGVAKVLDALSFALDNVDVIKADIEREESFLRGRGAIR